jgi:hypothetical protein
MAWARSAGGDSRRATVSKGEATLLLLRLDVIHRQSPEQKNNNDKNPSANKYIDNLQSSHGQIFRKSSRSTRIFLS